MQPRRIWGMTTIERAAARKALGEVYSDVLWARTDAEALASKGVTPNELRRVWQRIREEVRKRHE